MTNCEHRRKLRSDVGFLLCRNCDAILVLPDLTDLAMAEARGAI